MYICRKIYIYALFFFVHPSNTWYDEPCDWFSDPTVCLCLRQSQILLKFRIHSPPPGSIPFVVASTPTGCGSPSVTSTIRSGFLSALNIIRVSVVGGNRRNQSHGLSSLRRAPPLIYLSSFWLNKPFYSKNNFLIWLLVWWFHCWCNKLNRTLKSRLGWLCFLNTKNMLNKYWVFLNYTALFQVLFACIVSRVFDFWNRRWSRTTFICHSAQIIIIKLQ